MTGYTQTGLIKLPGRDPLEVAYRGTWIRMRRGISWSEGMTAQEATELIEALELALQGVTEHDRTVAHGKEA